MIKFVQRPQRFAVSEVAPGAANLVGWWDSSAQYCTVSGASVLSQMTDRSAAGNNLVNTAATITRPFWSASGGPNGYPRCYSTLTTQHLKKAFTLSVPCSVYLVVKRTASLDSNGIWSGINDNNFYGRERGGGAPHDLMIGGTNAIVAATINTWVIAGFALGSASTRYKKNLSAGAQDNNGIGAVSTGGFNLFSKSSLASGDVVNYACVMLYNIQHSLTEMTDVHTFLNNKYAIV